MKTISKIIIGSDAAASVVAHIVRSGQWVESSAISGDKFRVTVMADVEHLLPTGGETEAGEFTKLPHGLKIHGKPSTSIDYPQCVTPERFYMAVPCISTSHVKEEDMLIIERMGDSVMHLGRDSGPIIYWAPDESDDDLLDRFTSETYELSPEFLAVVMAFAHLGYNYLRLDSDGNEVTGLPVFEW